jgi:hypothetical protein
MPWRSQAAVSFPVWAEKDQIPTLV